MSGRVADMAARIHGIEQLGTVVNAMRGIAAARAQQARGQRAAVESYVQTIATAIGLVLNGFHDVPQPRRGCHPGILLFAAEEGFAGAFSERVFDAIHEDLEAELYLIGTRAISIASTRGLKLAWTAAMPSHSPGIPKLADRIGEALYPHIASGGIDCLDAVVSHWLPGKGARVERRRIFPIDTSAFSHGLDAERPGMNMPASQLLPKLALEYLHGEICKAAFDAFAAENEVRMATMAAARNQIERSLSSLRASQRIIRQEEITAEIIEIAAGATASRSGQDQV